MDQVPGGRSRARWGRTYSATRYPSQPLRECIFWTTHQRGNDVLEVAEAVSARRVLGIRARPFRYAVVTLVATAERRGPRRNTDINTVLGPKNY